MRSIFSKWAAVSNVLISPRRLQLGTPVLRRMHRPKAGNEIAKIERARGVNPIGGIRRSTVYSALQCVTMSPWAGSKRSEDLPNLAQIHRVASSSGQHLVAGFQLPLQHQPTGYRPITRRRFRVKAILHLGISLASDLCNGPPLLTGNPPSCKSHSRRGRCPRPCRGTLRLRYGRRRRFGR